MRARRWAGRNVGQLNRPAPAAAQVRDSAVQCWQPAAALPAPRRCPAAAPGPQQRLARPQQPSHGFVAAFREVLEVEFVLQGSAQQAVGTKQAGIVRCLPVVLAQRPTFS